MKNDRYKIIKEIRRKNIDQNMNSHLYFDFCNFLEINISSNPYLLTHYLRYLYTFSSILKINKNYFNKSKVYAETGGLSQISEFLISLGYDVKSTSTDLRMEMDIDTGSIDVIFSFEVIEHLKDKPEKSMNDLIEFNSSGVKQYIEEMNRILKPNGNIVLTTPNPCSLKSFQNIINYKSSMIYRPHVREYLKSELMNFFSEFNEIHYETFNSFFLIDEKGQKFILDKLKSINAPIFERGDNHFFIFSRII